MTRLTIQAWHTECSGCGYGSGGWASSPALDDKPILTPESRECPGCGSVFTEIYSPYDGTVVPVSEEAA